MNKDFLEVSPNSGAGNGSVNVTPSVNPNLGVRTTSVNVKTGSQSRAVSVQQYGLPFFGTLGIFVNDIVSNVTLDFMLIPEGHSTDQDENGNEFLVQTVGYRLPNISDIADTMWKMSVNATILTKLLDEYLNNGDDYEVRAFLGYRDGYIRVEHLKLLTASSNGGYQSFANKFTTTLGPGGQGFPAYIHVYLTFGDQSLDRCLFGYSFSQI